MASDVAMLAKRAFMDWLEKADQKDDDSLALLYFEWLTTQGLPVIGEDYGTAVEVLLLALSDNADSTSRPVVVKGDFHAWDFMTERGFRHECYRYNRALNTL